MKKKFLGGLVLMLAGALCALFGIEIRKVIQESDAGLRSRFPRRSEPRVKRKVWTDACPFCRGSVQVVDWGSACVGLATHTNERCPVWEQATTWREYQRSVSILRMQMARQAVGRS